jgi:putative transposase
MQVFVKKIIKMSFNPEKHHRRSIRLMGYDYTQAGSYFITICCDKGIHRLGKIENDKMIANEIGNVVLKEWDNLKIQYPLFIFDIIQIMPNHLHFIVTFPDNVENKISLPDVISRYKSTVLNKILVIYNEQNIIAGKFWQRNYYEHIIKDEKSYNNIYWYILNNPSLWIKNKIV